MAKVALLLALWVVCLVAVAVSMLWMPIAALVGSPRAMTIAKATDQQFNATTGGRVGQYLSDRAWAYRHERGWARALVDLLLAVDPDHFKDKPDAGQE